MSLKRAADGEKRTRAERKKSERVQRTWKRKKSESKREEKKEREQTWRKKERVWSLTRDRVPIRAGVHTFALIKLPQSLSPRPLAQETPPGHARIGPYGTPSMSMAMPILPPAACTRSRSPALSSRRGLVVSSVITGARVAASAGGASTRMANESPTLQHVSSERVSLSMHSVTVVPEVVPELGWVSFMLSMAKVFSAALHRPGPLGSP